MIITTAIGREIECDLVVRASQFEVLHIYTHSIDPIEAYQIFDNSEESCVLTVYEEGKDTRIYRGFTEVYCVEKGGLITGPGEILIWMRRPPEENIEEVIPNVS